MTRKLTILALVALLLAPAAAFSLPAADNAAEAPKGADAYPDGLQYKVVAGDTLWDLSAKYLGTPWKWGELWALNRFLTNPHYIYPGTLVTIFPARAKELTMVSPAEAPAAPAAAPAEPAAAPAPAPAAPAPAPAPVKKAAPASPPMLDIKPADFVNSGELVSARPKGIGKIRGGDNQKEYFSQGDKVFLNFRNPVPDGQLVGVYRVRGPVARPAPRKGTAGYVKYLIGVIQVTGTEGGATAGRVRFSFEDISAADLLTAEIPAWTPVVLKAGTPGLKAAVSSGRDDIIELSAGTVVYLDKGAKAGVEVGNTFTVYNEDSGKLDEVSGEVNPRIAVAKAVVLRVTQTSATAWVTYSKQPFTAGAQAVR